jgi:hypothetical protein
MMRQHPKTIGAPLAQSGLRQQQENRTHGVVAGARNNNPSCVGAVLAQTASRVSHPTRYAPAALCLRRRSLPHRWTADRNWSTAAPYRQGCVHNRKSSASRPAGTVPPAFDRQGEYTRPATDLPSILGPNLGPTRQRSARERNKINPLTPSLHRFSHSARRIERVCWKQTRAPARGQATGETPDDRRNLMDGRPDHLSKPGGWGPQTRTRSSIDIPFLFRAAVSGNWAGPVFENLGLPSLAARIRSASHPLSFRRVKSHQRVPQGIWHE